MITAYDYELLPLVAQNLSDEEPEELEVDLGEEDLGLVDEDEDEDDASVTE